jgi:hypothetical protein
MSKITWRSFRFADRVKKLGTYSRDPGGSLAVRGVRVE